MKIENGEKLLFIGDSVTDDNRARPVGEGNNAALGNGFVRLIDAYLAAEYPCRQHGRFGEYFEGSGRTLGKRRDGAKSRLGGAVHRLQRRLAAV